MSKKPPFTSIAFFAARSADAAGGVLESRGEVGAVGQEVGVLLAVFVFGVGHGADARPAELVAAAQLEQPDLV